MTRIKKLEERITALELVIEAGKKEKEYIANTWQETLLQFACDFNIDTPEIRKIAKRLKEKESRS